MLKMSVNNVNTTQSPTPQHITHTHLWRKPMVLGLFLN